jgi:hypothetical protein
MVNRIYVKYGRLSEFGIQGDARILINTMLYLSFAVSQAVICSASAPARKVRPPTSRRQMLNSS